MCKPQPGKRCIAHVAEQIASAEARLRDLAADPATDPADLNTAVTRVENLHWDKDCTRTGEKELHAAIENKRTSEAGRAEARRRLDRAALMNAARDRAVATMPPESMISTPEQQTARSQLADQLDDHVYLLRRQQAMIDSGDPDQIAAANTAVAYHQSEIDATLATHGWPKVDANKPGDTHTPYAMCPKCGAFGGSAHRCPLRPNPQTLARTPAGWKTADPDSRAEVTATMVLHGHTQCETCGQFQNKAVGHQCPGERVMAAYDWRDQIAAGDGDPAGSAQPRAVSEPEADDEPSPYHDSYGNHLGWCNACGEERELDGECCTDGEVVPYDDDPDPYDEGSNTGPAQPPDEELSDREQRIRAFEDGAYARLDALPSDAAPEDRERAYDQIARAMILTGRSGDLTPDRAREIQQHLRSRRCPFCGQFVSGDESDEHRCPPALEAAARAVEQARDDATTKTHAADVLAGHLPRPDDPDFEGIAADLSVARDDAAEARAAWRAAVAAHDQAKIDQLYNEIRPDENTLSDAEYEATITSLVARLKESTPLVHCPDCGQFTSADGEHICDPVVRAAHQQQKDALDAAVTADQDGDEPLRDGHLDIESEAGALRDSIAEHDAVMEASVSEWVETTQIDGTTLRQPPPQPDPALASRAPDDIDAEAARAYESYHVAGSHEQTALHKLHSIVGDQYDRRTGWEMTTPQVTNAAERIIFGKVPSDDSTRKQAERAIHDFDEALNAQNAAEVTFGRLEAEYQRRGGWPRAFLVNNQNGHVHKDRRCSTCKPTTQYKWMTDYSGKTEAEIVEAAGERACTVCYPTAPVSVLSRPTTMFTDEEIAAQQRAEERATARTEKEKKATADSVRGDGRPFTITTRGRAETFRTERSATQWYVSAHADWALKLALGNKPNEHQKGLYEGDEPAREELLAALAAKHGKPVEAVRNELDAKIAAKVKRDLPKARKEKARFEAQMAAMHGEDWRTKFGEE